MDKHIRMLGMLNVVQGALALVAVPFWLVAAGGLRGIYSSFNETFLGMLVAGLCIFNLLMAVPALLGGIFIQRYQEWARNILIVVSALNVLNFPLGCALGAYSLWALTTAESEPLFTDPPYPYNRKKAGKKSGTKDKPLKAKTGPILPSTSE